MGWRKKRLLEMKPRLRRRNTHVHKANAYHDHDLYLAHIDIEKELGDRRQRKR